MKEEMSSPDIPAASRPSFGSPGKPGDGEGGIGFRCELAPKFDAYINLIRSPLFQIVSAATPSLSRLSHSVSSHNDVQRGSRDLQRTPSRHSSREAATTSEFDLNAVASKFTTDMKNAQAEIEELVRHPWL